MTDAIQAVPEHRAAEGAMAVGPLPRGAPVDVVAAAQALIRDVGGPDV